MQAATARAKIRARLDQVEAGNLGYVRAVGKGVCELRIDYGPGYRVYFGQLGTTVFLLLCGGDKSSQDEDIRQSIEYWTDYGNKKMSKSVSYHTYLIESLKDPSEASA